MDEKWGNAVLVTVVSVNSPVAINVFQIAFNGDVSSIKAELKLPVSEANLLKFLADEKFEFGCVRKRVHFIQIANPLRLRNVLVP